MSRQNPFRELWYMHIWQQSRGGQIRKWWVSMCDLRKIIFLQNSAAAREVCLTNLMCSILTFSTLDTLQSTDFQMVLKYVYFDFNIKISLPERFSHFFTNEMGINLSLLLKFWESRDKSSLQHFYDTLFVNISTENSLWFALWTFSFLL